MSITEQIDQAIAAHGKWKSRLELAIQTGTSEFEVAKVSVDNQCDFGKWLYSLPAAQRTSDHWKKVQQLHAEFHRTASEILKNAVNGKKQDAIAALEKNGPYTAISAKLVFELMNWKRIIG